MKKRFCTTSHSLTEGFLLHCLIVETNLISEKDSYHSLLMVWTGPCIMEWAEKIHDED
jgi:hypothetical protein